MDGLTFGDALDLLEYWREHPPTHALLHQVVKGLAGGGGTGTQRLERAAPPTREELEAFVAQFKR